MAVPATVDEFLDLVRKSGVADDKRLDAFLAKSRSSLPTDPAKTAGVLVQNGLLTNFQAENILAGKWRRFSIGKYKVLERLGSGGFAQVYLCEHKLMRRRVAVKVLPVAKAKDSSALERFYREARAVAALDHPNIVHAYDIDQDEDLHFLVMEYVDGSNLLDIVKRSGPLSVLRACHYIQQSALALQHAHENGLVHRDIKPGNILVDRTGVVKVLDMGLALFFQEEDEQLTRKHDDGTLGTADYLSPEQAMDSHDVDIRTDIYSLGVTFYFLLTGKAPYEGLPVAQKLLAHQMKQPPAIAQSRKDVPADVLAIIDKMMAKNVAARFATPGDVADALEPFTQTPIGPPTDAEMPHLSPAAMGQGSDTSGPKSDSMKEPGSGKGVKPAAVISPPAPLPKPTSPPAPAPVQTAAAVAPPSPAPVAPESAPWEEANADTRELDGADTPSLDARPTDKMQVSPAAARRNRFLVIALVSAFVVIPMCLTVTIGSVMFFFFKKDEEDKKPPPPRFEVSKDPARKNAKRSIKAALAAAEVDSVIEIWDEVVEENVYVELKRKRITLQAAEGREVVWRSATNDPITPILRIHKTAEFRFKGKGITFDGTLDKKGRANNLIMLTGDCPGTTVEDAQLKNFANAGIFIINAAGSEKGPLKLSGLKIFQPDGAKVKAAIYFDANPQVTPNPNDDIVIESSEFPGFDGKAIQVRPSKDAKDPPVNGPNVRS